MEPNEANSTDSSLLATLFPHGIRADDEQQRKELIDSYRFLCQDSELLGSRRQALNNFFLSLNSMLIAGIGMMIKEAVERSLRQTALTGIMVFIAQLAAAGLLLAWHWRGLIRNYAGLQRANDTIARTIESKLAVSVLSARRMLTTRDHISLAEMESHIALIFTIIYSAIVISAITMIVIEQVRPIEYPKSGLMQFDWIAVISPNSQDLDRSQSYTKPE
jgi:predicted small integral membrane protein